MTVLDEQKWKNGLDVIYLASCALHGKTPDKDTVEAMDHGAVYDMAKFHGMQAITGMALGQYEETVSPELTVRYKHAKDKTKKRILLYTIEREKLTRFMDKAGIWYLPLKGIIMQDLYPVLGMRQLADNDILIDISRRADVKKYFEDNGYEVKQFGRDSHDVYLKDPVFNFEMHVYLCNRSIDPVIHEYYSNVRDRLIKDEGDNYGYHFNTEDFYIHTLVHAHKHFAHSGGVGFRVLQDIYVYLNKYGDIMDMDYLAAELNKIKLAEFEEKMKSLAMKLFSSECVHAGNDPELLTTEDAELLDFLIGSGSYGVNTQTLRQNLGKLAGKDGKINTGVKFKYYINRLFPTGLYLEENFPFLYKHKYLIPFFWIYRLFKKLFTRAGYIFKEFIFISKQ